MAVMPVSTRPRPRRPTLEQVARYAGVSRATVSRVVNGSTSVDAALREVVEQAVDELGYVPNPAARSLMTRRTDTVTLVAAESSTRFFSDPFFAQIVRGVSLQLADTGIQLNLSMPQTDDQVATLTRYLAGGHTDGVLLISEHGRHRISADLAARGVPVVIGGRPLDPSGEVSYVDNDNVDGGRQAAAYLRRRGRRAIGTIGGPQDMSAGMDRLVGFRQGLGRDFRAGRVVYGDFTMASGEAAARQLLQRRPDTDAIFVASDLMALGAVREVRRTGRRVPDDVAVVGYDDIDLARLSEPPLTTVRQDAVGQGRTMALLLLDALGRATAEVPTATTEDGRGVILPVELIERASA